jgi:hypothetical protein
MRGDCLSTDSRVNPVYTTEINHDLCDLSPLLASLADLPYGHHGHVPGLDATACRKNSAEIYEYYVKWASLGVLCCFLAA